MFIIDQDKSSIICEIDYHIFPIINLKENIFLSII